MSKPTGHHPARHMPAAGGLAPVKLAALGVLLAAVSGCSLWVAVDETQCETAADCEAATGYGGWACEANLCQSSGEGPWGCLHTIGNRQVEAGAGQIKLIDKGTDRLITDARVKVCTFFDIECATPLMEFEGANAQDVYEFVLPEAFDGHLEVTSPGRMPTLVRISPYAPFHYGDVHQRDPLPMVSPLLFGSIVLLAGETPQPDTALLVGAMVDCQVNYTAGMRASLKPDADQTIFYLKDSHYPDLDATATDINGLWGAINLEPGFAEALAHRETDGGFVGKVGFLLRANYVTVISIGPSPQ